MNKKLLEKLRRVWERNPGLRFCQLLENAIGCRREGCWFYLPDEEVVELLDEFVEAREEDE